MTLSNKATEQQRDKEAYNGALAEKQHLRNKTIN